MLARPKVHGRPYDPYLAAFPGGDLLVAKIERPPQVPV